MAKLSFDIEKHVSELGKDGYTIVHDVMPPSELDATKRAIEEALAYEEEIGRRVGMQTEDLRTVFEAQGKHPHLYGLVLRNPKPIQVARRLLDDDVMCYSLTIRNPMPTGHKDTTKLGGHMHVDFDTFTVHPFMGGKHYMMAIQSAWCISGFTKESGGTMIWPGSHLSLQAPFHDSKTVPPGYIIAEAPAGSVIMWDSALWHTAGVNYGDSPRYTIISYFQRRWIKGYNDAYHRTPAKARDEMTEEELRLFDIEPRTPPNTHIKAMSPEQLAALTTEEKAVLGFAVHD